MTETPPTLPDHPYTHWESINWPKAEKVVKGLQKHIVKTTQEEGRGKVKDLHRLKASSVPDKGA